MKKVEEVETRQKKDKKDKKGFNFLSLFKNPWRVAFLTLLAVVIGFISVLMFRISTPRMTYDAKLPVIETKEKAIFDINMKKEQVNDAINFFLEESMKESGVDYSFVLENQAMIDGTFNLLGHETHFYLYFEPYVLNDGNVQLKAKSLSVGSLNVPIPAMINYISSTTDLPNWIEMDADQQLINLHLNKFQLDNGMSIRAKKINLINDEISFSIYLPKEKSNKK
ncbi:MULTISPECIES: YpmS family protein [Vagococcus]|uniref:YpmS family protein n=1 Tax=Vagococcus TaxID=2737 RepID=UPI002FC5FFF1